MTADEIMRACHRGMRDDPAFGLAYGRGAADALLRVGQLSATEHRLWEMALKTCPGHGDEGGRAWCAYCGNLPPDPPDGGRPV